MATNILTRKHVKMGELPGDISRRAKIALLEGRVPYQCFPWQVLDEVHAKAAKNFMKEKSIGVERRRGKKECRITGR